MLKETAIVLVEPQSPGNIGMACRAIKNMGLSCLRIVNGCDRFHPESLKFAVSAKDILEKAELFPDVSSAIADCAIAVGTTRRQGKYRRELLTPPEVAELIGMESDSRGAIVFGREDSGLTTDELSVCSIHATIPSAHEYGSLNLAQSVLLFCYELSRLSTISVIPVREEPPATSAEMEAFFNQFKTILTRTGFLNGQNPEHIIRSIRRIFFRAGMDSREVAIMRGVLTQFDWAASGFDGRKRS